MKKALKGYVAGVLSTIFLLAVATGVFAVAASRTENISVTFNNIGLVVNGQRINPTDAQGNAVEPFIWDGTTYLPVRALADALEQDVRWDGSTNTVYIGQEPSQAQTREIMLFDLPAVEIDNAAWFNTDGDARTNFIRLHSFGNLWSHSTRDAQMNTRFNHVVYALDANPNARFSGTINSMEWDQMTKIYRIFGDGRLLWTSPVIHSGTAPLPFDIDVSGVGQLKIELELTIERTRNVSNANRHNWGSIENAIITITQ